MKNKLEYIELSKASINEKRDIIISKVNSSEEQVEAEFTVAQRVEVEEAGRKLDMFIKGAFHIKDINGLYEFRDAINVAIERANEMKRDEEDNWDN